MVSIRSKLIWLFLKYVLSKQAQGLSLEEERKFLDNLGKKEKLPPQIKVQRIKIQDVTVESLTGSHLREDKVILYLHGGAYNLGSCDSHRILAALIAQAAGMRLILLEYRLAPEFPFPAAVEDVVVTYEGLISQGVLAKNIAFVGDSAGGGLVISSVLALREKGQTLPAAIVCMSPWVDLGHTGGSIHTKAKEDVVLTLKELQEHAFRYIGTNDYHDPMISPIYADLSGFPPILIQVGEKEILLDDSKRLAQQAKCFHVDVTLEVWDQMFHVFQYFSSYMPESKRALDKIGQFLKAKVS